MILQFKTNTEVIVNPVTLAQDYVVLTICNEGPRTPLATSVDYKYEEFESKRIIKSGSWTITNDELNAIASMTQYPENATEVVRRNLQIITGVMYTLGSNPDFGLTPANWELYVENP